MSVEILTGINILALIIAVATISHRAGKLEATVVKLEHQFKDIQINSVHLAVMAEKIKNIELILSEFKEDLKAVITSAGN